MSRRELHPFAVAGLGGDRCLSPFPRWGEGASCPGGRSVILGGGGAWWPEGLDRPPGLGDSEMLSPSPSVRLGAWLGFRSFPRPGDGRTGREGWRPLPARPAALDDA